LYLVVLILGRYILSGCVSDARYQELYMIHVIVVK